MNQRIDAVGVEGWRANEQFINDDAQTPQIDGVVVRQLLNQLWRHVQGCTFDGGENDCVGGHRASKSKVTKFDYSVCRDQDVLGLHVSMDDAVAVQVIQRMHQLLGNLAHFLLSEVAIVI